MTLRMDSQPQTPSSTRRPPKLAEVVARGIVKDIASARWKPGEKLPSEQVMRDRFQVGRGTLREALRILEIQGIVYLRPGPGGGPVVAADAVQDFGRMSSLHFEMRGVRYRELMDARIAMEPVMARLAAERVDDEVRRQLREHLSTVEALDEDDAGQLDLWADFHDLLGSLSGNGVLELFGASLQDIYRERVVYRESFKVVRGVAKQTNSDHAEIAKAISDGNAARAERLTRLHMELHLLPRHRGLLGEVITWDQAH